MKLTFEDLGVGIWMSKATKTHKYGAISRKVGGSGYKLCFQVSTWGLWMNSPCVLINFVRIERRKCGSPKETTPCAGTRLG